MTRRRRKLTEGPAKTSTGDGAVAAKRVYFAFMY